MHDLPFLADGQKVYNNTDKIEHKSDTSETLNQNIDHTEEVIIGTEHSMTFPTQIGTSVCHALVDTGATRSCISEKYYQSLPLTKIQFVQNINTPYRRSRGGSITHWIRTHTASLAQSGRYSTHHIPRKSGVNNNNLIHINISRLFQSKLQISSP